MSELNDVIKELSKDHDSYYIYDERSIVERVEKLKTAFSNATFLYSVKCNHNKDVLGCVFSHGFGADAASSGEVMLASEAGLSREMIYYSAPGKSVHDIREAWDKARIIADSTGEIELIEEIAAKEGCRVDIGVRINPDFSFDGGEGLASKFGIDEEQFFQYEKKNGHPHVKITGLHVHLKSQELHADVLKRYYRNIEGLAERIEKQTGEELDFINFGSGIGVPYAEGDREIDMETLAQEISGIQGKRKSRILIETGRYAVCKCGYYVTKVMDRKVSHGKTYIILKNTMNGFLRPSLAKLIERYAASDDLPGTEPLYTGKDSFQFTTLKENSPEEKVSLAGNLCTAADVIAEDIMMPHLERGDVLIINNAGAYAAVLSPMQFSSQKGPEEFFLRCESPLSG